MNIDLQDSYFSRYGSYFVINNDAGDKWNPPGVYLRSVFGTQSMHHRLFRLVLLEGDNECDFSISASPEKLTMESEHGTAEFCIHTDRCLRIRVRGVVLRMTLVYAVGIWQDAYSRVLDVEENEWDLHCYTIARKYRLRKLMGEVVVDAPWNGKRADYMTIRLDGIKQPTEISMVEYQKVFCDTIYADDKKLFDTCVSDVSTEHQVWQSMLPVVPEEFKETAELAFYVNWASVARAEGNFKRPAMLMSKKHMNQIWSWDHCFNAWGHVHKNPEFALDQWFVMFDHQDESGLLPDFINSVEISWMCTKPPVHGWIIGELLNRMQPLSAATLSLIYEKLVKLTNCWFNKMVLPDNKLPHYTHGNDSGWDNSTMFCTSSCVCGPDLMAFLILQMDVCADIAKRLNNGEEVFWKQKADTMLELFISTYWKGDRFVAFEAFSKEEISCQSLITYMPIILGERLPHDIRQSLVNSLKNSGFIAEYGLATESLNSSYFCRNGYDGYWRGPIWAPSTLIVLEGLKKCGELTLVKNLALSYCEMCRDNGFAENFDPITGKGLCDIPYTWTSSVFIILAHEYLVVEQ
ncbi:MAG: hypothetical protein PF692_06190 [Kiritimatiellae bacterium]|jgi:putative isomerase|nr:hypothetical protein [Kiritimatiellia bacterium]